jgi:hypothetical protein
MTFHVECSLSTRRWPAAYQSVSDLAFCPQTAFPFELCGLPKMTPKRRFALGPTNQAEWAAWLAVSLVEVRGFEQF